MSSPHVEGYPAPPGLDLPPARALLDLVGKASDLAEPWSRFARALASRGRLEPAERELVILRVAALNRCEYVLAGHRRIARHHGLARDRIAAAVAPEPPARAHPALDRRARLLLEAVDALVDGGRLTPELTERLQDLMGAGRVVELILLVGQYTLISQLCRSFDLPAEPGLELSNRSRAAPNVEGTGAGIGRACPEPREAP